jgi:hypothetical protein
MKKYYFVSIILLFAFFGCNNSETKDFIFLNAEQLKPLGIEISEDGVFYKNCNPNSKESNEKFECLGFYATNETYLATLHFDETDSIKVSSNIDSLLLVKELTRHEFCPILIGNTKGDYSLDSENKNIKLLPIAICLNEIEMLNRKDTLVFWFKHHESIEKLLPEGTKIKNYLRFPDKK